MPSNNTDGTALSDLAGFRIYYGTNPASLSNSVDVGASVTRQSVGGLTAGTYYFAVTARNTGGQESDASNMASATVQ